MTGSMVTTGVGRERPAPSYSHSKGTPKRFSSPIQSGRVTDRHRESGQDGESVGWQDWGRTPHTPGKYESGAFASFSPDGTRIVTASTDHTAKGVGRRDGDETLTLKGHNGPVRLARFSSDGTRILTAGFDGHVRMFDARPVNREFLPREPAPSPRESK